MRPLVPDASAALAYLVREPDAGRVRRELEGRDAVLVPWVFWSEVINVLARRHRWPGSEVLAAVYDLEQFGITTVPPSRQAMLSVIDAVGTQGLTAYDSEYFVLAEVEDADLLTGDAFLAGAAGKRAIRIGVRHRLGEQVTAYAMEGPSRDATWPDWPGAAMYVAELRREAVSDLEALREGR